MTSESLVARPWFLRLSLGNVLIALPAAHLLVASLYTWGWLAGFGANVAVLADPRDLFSVSMSKLVIVYAISLVVPVVQSVLMFRGWKRGGAGSDGAISGALTPRFTSWVLVAIFGLLLAALLLCFDLLHRGQPQGLAMLMLAQLAAIPTGKFLIDHLTLQHSEFQAVSVAVGLLFGSLGFGVADGNFARYATYGVKEGQVIECGDKLVLRRFGENYIGIAPGDRKVVTGLECKVVMVVPPVRKDAARQFHWRPYPHFHYVSPTQQRPLHGSPK
jgi:hypothetical protein